MLVVSNCVYTFGPPYAKLSLRALQYLRQRRGNTETHRNLVTIMNQSEYRLPGALPAGILMELGQFEHRRGEACNFCSLRIQGSQSPLGKVIAR